jgi:phosphate transport system substrate-binding protein
MKLRTQMANRYKMPPIFFIAVIGVISFGVWKILPFSHSPEKSVVPDRPLDPSELMSSTKDIPTGTFRYGGSTSWAPIRAEVDAVLRFGIPNFKLKYIHPNGSSSSEKGIEMLLAGQLDFAQSSKGIPAESQKLATKKGVKIKEILIAIDAMTVVVHPSLKLPGITLEQLHEITTGKIKNWRVIGGADLPIHIYSLNGEELNGALFTPIRNSTDAFQKVSIDPSGIHLGASSTLAVPQCRIKTLPIGTGNGKFVAPYQLPAISPADCSSQNHNQVNPTVFQTAAYPLLRKLSVIVVENDSLKQRAGEAYARMLQTAQGQTLIKKAGYLNLQ